MVEHVCGTSRFFGCRFSIYPMSDQFVELITNALKEVDTSKVWIEIDDVSTCVRGKEVHVFDVVKGIFVHVAKTGVHVVLNATFSSGCPGDSTGDFFLAADDHPLNEENSQSHNIETAVNFSLYPLGVPNYMEQIEAVIKIAKKRGTFTKGIHYTSRLDGDVQDVFKTLRESYLFMEDTDTNHVVMTAVVSANSPSVKK